MKLKLNLLPLSAVFLCSTLPSFASSLCDATPGNIVANCGFENGVTSSTIGGYTNTNVPTSWTANYGFDIAPGFNHLANPNSGSYSLSIGNYDTDPAPALSQNLTDIAGATYAGSLFVDYGGAGTSDTLPFFDVQIDGANLVALTNTAPGVFTEYTFSFMGTGADTLTLTGNTSPSEWLVDDVSVVESSGPVITPVGATPEPASLLLLATASGPFFFLRQRFAKR